MTTIADAFNPFTVDVSAELTSIFGPQSPGLAGLLDQPETPGDDGYATTVEEEQFLSSTSPPDFGTLSFPDLKGVSPHPPGIVVDSALPLPSAVPQSMSLPLELAFSQQFSTAFVPPAPTDGPTLDDASTAALLHILTQAALQQTQSLHELQQAQGPAATPALSPSIPSVSPRDVSPTRIPRAPSVGTGEARHERRGSSATPSIQDGSKKTKRKRPVREASELLPLDAPVQKRSYLAPSATSRRELPELEEGEQDANIKAILDKRLKNTLAARQSRRRRAEELAQLKSEKEELAMENAELKRHLQDAAAELASLRLRLDVLRSTQWS